MWPQLLEKDQIIVFCWYIVLYWSIDGCMHANIFSWWYGVTFFSQATDVTSILYLLCFVGVILGRGGGGCPPPPPPPQIQVFPSLPKNFEIILLNHKWWLV